MGTVTASYTAGTLDKMLQMTAGLLTEYDLELGVYSSSTIYVDGTDSSSRSGATITRETSLTNNTEATIDVDGSIIRIYDSGAPAYVTLASSSTPGGVSDPWEDEGVFKCKISLTFTR